MSYSNRPLSFARFLSSSGAGLALAFSGTLAIGSAAFVGIGLPVPAAAAETDWSGATSSDWLFGGNWNNGAPTAAEDVVINTTTPNPASINAGNAFASGVYIGTTVGAPGALTISAGGTLDSVEGIVGNGLSSQVTVTGPGSDWTNTGKLNIGSSGVGVLTVSNGGDVTNAIGTLGNFLLSDGSATITGPGSTWTNADLFVGAQGRGALTISNGGAVSSASAILGDKSTSTGTAFIVNFNSTWTNGSDFTVGNFGHGAVLIANGGTVSNSNGYLGKEVNSTGMVTVDGTSSTWTNASSLVVGDAGTGTMQISGGGVVSNFTGMVGNINGSTGQVEVRGTGSTWTNSSDLGVGVAGRGTMAISQGGTVSNAFGTIGDAAGSVGVVSVVGAGSSWTSTSNLYVGNNGMGTLTVRDNGTVSSAGDFVIAASTISTGVLNIGGAAGSAAAASGTLNGGTVRFGDGAGTLNFNHTNSAYAFAPVIDGLDGTINQIAGTTNLTANSSSFLGATNVLGGRLAVNGSLAGSLVTVYGGMLGGNGTVGGIVAQAGGIIGPGNSIGTLNVAGNVTQAAGSAYQVELTSTGTSDLIHATGNATIASGALIDVVKLDAAPYVGGTHYMVLQADGGITGTYTITGDIGTAFLGLVDSYDANHLYLDLVQKTFAQVGLTPNQKAAGGAAENLGAGNPLYDGLVVLPTAAIAQVAFDQISGEIHASAKTAMIEDSRFLREAVMDRLRTAPDGGGVWGRGFGSFGEWNGDGNAGATTRNTGGFFVGADGVVGSNWRLGVTGGFGHSSLGVADRNSTGRSDDYHVGLYGGANWGDVAFRSGLAYSWHDIATSRSAAFPGFAETLKGDYDAATKQAFGELGYRLQAGGIALEPFANFAYVDVTTNGTGETGGAAALNIGGASTHTAFTTLGLRASTSFTLGDGTTMTARGMVGWRHAFGDITPVSSMAFAGGSAFGIAGVPIAQDTAAIDLGLDLDLTPSTTLGLAYGGQVGSGLIDQTIKGTFNVKF